MISNWMKAVLFLLSIAVNKLVTILVFFHWLSCCLFVSCVFILSRMCSLIFPISYIYDATEMPPTFYTVICVLQVNFSKSQQSFHLANVLLFLISDSTTNALCPPVKAMIVTYRM